MTYYYFIRYNKLFYILYYFFIMLLFNMYSTTSYCEENIIEEKIKENTTNNYLYYLLITLASITIISTCYLITAYYVPDLDILHIFDNKNELTPMVSRYGFNSLLTHNIEDNYIYIPNNNQITIDECVFNHLIQSLEYYHRQNMVLIEQNQEYQRQLSDIIRNLNIHPQLNINRPTPLEIVRRNSFIISSEDITSPIFEGVPSRTNSFSSTTTELFNNSDLPNQILTN